MKTFKMLVAILAAFAAYGCGGIETVSTPTAETTPAPVAAAPIAAQPPQGISAGSSVHDWWIRADGTFYVQNLSEGTTTFHACARRVYPGGDQDWNPPYSKVDGGPIPPGDIWRGQLTVTGCYMELEILESPNTCEDFKQVVGARYINVGLYCSKPPPPPVPTPTPTPVPTPTTTPRPTPTPTPKPSPTPTPCQDNGQGCIPSPVPTPTPCPAAHFTGQATIATTGTFSAMAHATGVGNWRLAIYATSDLSEYGSNLPDYVKDTDIATTTCETAASLAVSYGWVGHPSRYWWADLKVGGVRVWKSAVIEHQ